DFSWILTKDRKFQSAQRTRFFQTRFTQVGNYVLDVSVQNPGGGQNDYRAFTITVTEPLSVMPLPPPAPPQEGAPLAAIFMTNPAPAEGKVYLPPEGGILKIDPSASQGGVTSHELDLDNNVDADGDGNPTNDVDNVNTSSEKSGTPLFFFLIPNGTERKITLTVRDAGKGQSNTASIDVVFGPAPNIPQAQNPNSPILMKQDGLTVSFSALSPATQSGGAQLLNEWNFGDRTRSLLTAPMHTYAAPGVYTVSLTVRDILTGQIIYAGTEVVEVAVATISSAQSQQAVQSSATPASSAASTGGGGGSLTLSGSIVKVGVIVFILLAIAIGLYALFTWIKRKTTGSLEKTFERMEQTILKQDPKAAVKTGKVEPMKLKKEPLASPMAKTQENLQEEVSDRENTQAEFHTQDRAPITPIADAGPVPDWLKKAPSPPLPRQDSAKQQPTPSSAAKIPEGKASVPPWLQQTTPETQPTPEKTPVPSPPPAPPAAAPASSPVPDWLKPAQTAATSPAPPASPSVSLPPRQQPAPETPKPLQPTAKPQPTPKLVTPQTQPFAKLPSTPTPKPAPAQAQQAPKPQTSPPLQAPAKAPSPPVQPKSKPQPTSLPPPSPKPENNGDEPPIAIIQADSLTKQ
ncbi:MAG: PKD domain-containing protein, partial [Candidatus Peribacteraceae bacterium]